MPKSTKKQIYRILSIEDNIVRINIFRGWLYDSAKLVDVSSGGKAMGLLKRDNNRNPKNGRVYSGILLDHDLQEQPITAQDRSLSSSHLVDLLIENIFHDVPILMHSMNQVEAITMKKRLESAGFSVTQHPFKKLTKAAFDEWLSYCYALWEDYLEDY